VYNFETYTVYYLKGARRQGFKDHRNYLQITLNFLSEENSNPDRSMIHHEKNEKIKTI
jgi:hypothetical protein